MSCITRKPLPKLLKIVTDIFSQFLNLGTTTSTDLPVIHGLSWYLYLINCFRICSRGFPRMIRVYLPGMPFEKAGHGWGKFLFPVAAVSAPIVSYAYLAPRREGSKKWQKLIDETLLLHMFKKRGNTNKRGLSPCHTKVFIQGTPVPSSVPCSWLVLEASLKITLACPICSIPASASRMKIEKAPALLRWRAWGKSKLAVSICWARRLEN